VRPEKGKGNAEVVLTATIRRGTVSAIKTFIVTVLEHPGVAYSLNIDAEKPGIAISPDLYGIFFEDINHAADGGIYAELISNRSFEDNSNNPDNWYLVKGGGASGSMSLDTVNLLNNAQAHSLCLNIESVGQGERVGVANRGYWGMNIKDGTQYQLSFYAKCSSDFNGPITVSLKNTDGTEKYVQETVTGITTDWKHFSCVLTAEGSSKNAQLVIAASDTGEMYLDVVSLFPETWKRRSNDLRVYLAEKVADLKPAFVRFPGGCFVEGDTLANAFRWKNTIGDIAERPGHWILWGYRATDGLGYHEYLQWGEDLGADPLFVVNCGISHNGSVPMEELQSWIQDALDAIEYANGPVTSTWGAKRAANGHPEPFNLKYVEIGNENNFQYSDYVQRYLPFYNAIKEKYPDIILIANCNIPGQPIDYIDEHYYSLPQWFINNAHKYDNYDRQGPKIYVGEYAVTKDCGLGNLHAAIGEAAFMTGVERNSDIVRMASYAPLFVNVRDRRWNPDAICFDSASSYGTPSYYVQKMFSENVGDRVLSVTLTEHTKPEAPAISGAIGLGSWTTQVEYDDVKVTKNTGEVLFSDDFSSSTDGWNVYKGSWQTQNGVY
jgi:alpha-L-arabinofuranosidase